MKYPELQFRVFLFKEIIMEKVCPNCKKTFDCKADDIKSCKCNSIEVNTESLEMIKLEFENCLCFECLKQYEKFLTS